MAPSHVRDAQTSYHMAAIKNEYGVEPTHDTKAPVTGLVPAYEEPRPTTGQPTLEPVPDLYMSDTTTSSLAWADNAGMTSSASESSYSTSPSDSYGFQHQRVRPSSSEWSNGLVSFPVASRELQSPILATGYGLSFGYNSSPPQIYASVYGDSMGLPLPGYEDGSSLYGVHHIPDATIRGLSPQLVAGQSAEACVTTPSALPSDRMAYPRTCGREPVDALGLFSPQGLMPVALSREARGAVPAYLEVYWDKFHAKYPVIHRPTFENASGFVPEHLDVLQSAMAAIATQFLEHQEHRNTGNQLHAYAWNKSKMVRHNIMSSYSKSPR